MHANQSVYCAKQSYNFTECSIRASQRERAFLCSRGVGNVITNKGDNAGILLMALPCFHLLFITCFLFPTDEAPVEYCERDSFNVTCKYNEVILITYAKYGRMGAGRCISGSFGPLDCSMDARNILDRKCGGRRGCEAVVATLVPEDRQPCGTDLRSSLEVAYQCVRGETFSQNRVKD
jgi:hypothetical protein